MPTGTYCIRATMARVASGGYSVPEVRLDASTGLHHLQPSASRRALCGLLPRVLRSPDPSVEWEDLEIQAQCPECAEVIEAM